MSTPTPTDPPVAVDPPPARSRWRRPRGRGAVIGLAVVALLVVGGVVAALLVPWGRHSERVGPVPGAPGVGLSGGVGGELGDLGGRGGPGRPGGPGGPRGGGDQGLIDRGLGSDTLLAGTVVSTGNGTLVVAVDGKAQRTIRTDSRTRVQGNGTSALGDLKAGERVVVRVTGTGDAATAVAVEAPQARVTGTVTALAGDTATVTTIDGLTVTVDVSALSQKPAVGNLVVLTGTATNGTTVKADGIRILPAAA